MPEQIYDVVLNSDDISWKSVIYDLVKSEGMNPWNIDVTLLTKRYIDRIREMQELDFRVSGKVLLAAALLLRIKGNYLLSQDIEDLDRLIARGDEFESDEFFSEFDECLFEEAVRKHQKVPLIPRTPQPRQRKVTINDLLSALQKAMEVKKRRIDRVMPPPLFEVPKKKIDIGQLIKDVYTRVRLFFQKKPASKLTFSELLLSDTKENKVFTLIPLLHLDNQRKINLHQERSFGEIDISLFDNQK